MPNDKPPEPKPADQPAPQASANPKPEILDNLDPAAPAVPPANAATKPAKADGALKKIRNVVNIYTVVFVLLVLAAAAVVYVSVKPAYCKQISPVQRVLIGLSSVAAAEHMRDEEKKDILFFADNMYRYVQAHNELATILGQIPSEGGYEATIFSDVKTLQDRLSSNDNGSITSVQTIYVPADDLSDPAVQMIQHELDGTIVLSRKVAEQGIRPSVDLIRTTSSLLSPDVVGDRHYNLSVEVQSLLQKHESLKNIIAIIGESELSPVDRSDFAKAKELIQYFSQNMFVSELFTNKKGEYSSREDTLKGVEKILNSNVQAAQTT